MFLVPYKTPSLEIRAKWIKASNYDEARKIVRAMKKNDPNIYFVVTYPIAILDKEIDQ